MRNMPNIFDFQTLNFCCFHTFQSDLPQEPHDSTLFMNWAGDKIILLAKKKRASLAPNVYLSSNFGKNWTKINSKLNRGSAVIDQIYVSKVNQNLVSVYECSLY